MRHRPHATLNFVLRMTGASLILFCSGFAALWSIRLALADYYARQDTVADTEKAIALTPGQAIYYARLAFLLSDSNPSRATQLLERAVQLNPQDARSWIELGLRSEANGNSALAERYLLEAARINSEYLPRWTLANYYYRQNDIPRFWYWAKLASERVYDDPKPLFLLCGRVIEDGNLLDRLQIHAPQLTASYLAYLLEIDRLDLIPSVVKRVLEERRPSDTPLLLFTCDLLLKENQPDEAMRIWNALAANRQIPVKGFQEATSAITNGAFLTEPISQGFDWRIYRNEGISASSETPNGLRVTLSGSEPEHVDILSQYVPVQGGKEYSFSFLYRTSGIAANTGLAWRATDMEGNDIALAQASLSSEDEAQAEFPFVVPPDCRLIRLLLEYRRRPGTTRIGGYVVLRSVGLHPVTSVAVGAAHALLQNEVKKDGKE